MFLLSLYDYLNVRLSSYEFGKNLLNLKIVRFILLFIEIINYRLPILDCKKKKKKNTGFTAERGIYSRQFLVNLISEMNAFRGEFNRAT